MYVDTMLRSAAAMLLLLTACGPGGLMRHGVRCEQDGETVLMRASSMGRTEVVVQLLDKGADVNAQDKVCGGACGARTWSREGALVGDTEDSEVGWEMAVTRTHSCV